MDPYWAERIVANAAIRPGELVVDLGAGTGALTIPLLRAGARVIAVELHAERARQLRTTVNGYAASVVECDLEDFVPPGRPVRLVANPPYALTASVLSFAARASHLTPPNLVFQRAAVRRVVDQGRRDLRRFSARQACRYREMPSYHLHPSTQPSSNSDVERAHHTIRNLGLRSFGAVCIRCNLRRPSRTYVNVVFLTKPIEGDERQRRT